MNKVKLLKTLIAEFVFIAGTLLVFNAYHTALECVSIHSVVSCWVQILALTPIICIAFVVSFIEIYREVKRLYILLRKKLGKDEVSTAFKLKTHFDLGEFPETYCKVYDANNKFIGYLVEKKEIINN